MTPEKKIKVSRATFVAILALVWSIAVYFYGKAAEAGETKEKISQLESWKEAHQKRSEDGFHRLDNVENDVHWLRDAVEKRIEPKLDRILQKR